LGERDGCSLFRLVDPDRLERAQHPLPKLWFLGGL
jgi:hypothetical protein